MIIENNDIPDRKEQSELRLPVNESVRPVQTPQLVDLQQLKSKARKLIQNKPELLKSKDTLVIKGDPNQPHLSTEKRPLVNRWTTSEDRAALRRLRG